MSVELRPFGVACNIACRYCYQNPQRAAGNFRQAYQLDLMKAAVTREGGPFILFGGEPLLLPLTDLEELFRWGLEQYGHNGIQTNGVLISEEHIRLFQRYKVNVGISIDGPDDLNDLRWHVDEARTRQSTARTQASIARLCREYQPPGLIVTLHRLNATAERLPRLHTWMRELDAQGVRSVRLHLLEVESEAIRAAYSLSEAENVQALLSFADLQEELPQLRFDVLEEMERNLLGRDGSTSCVWHACDPYTTEAVRGVEGNGQSSNCGRTNKDGVNFIKGEQRGFERYLALYHTPQEHGGCQGCRFFLMCKGQCPGTAIGGDWRNRSELCGVWKQVFIHLEKKLILQDQVPLSIHPVRQRLEQHMLARWAAGGNSTIQALPWTAPGTDGAPGTGADPDHPPGPRLSAFVRLAFVGEAQRATWHPRIAAVRAALAQIGVLTVARRLARVSLIRVAPADVFTIHNLAAAHGLHAVLRPGDAHTRDRQMIIGSQTDALAYEDACAAGDTPLLDSWAGLPVCCQQANARFRVMGITDPTWMLAAAEPEATASTADVRCQPTMNLLLQPLGLDLLGYFPCGFHCTASQDVAAARLALGAVAGLTAPLDWLTGMLDWPAEWSALHGIAELKTGIMKVAYNTDYTAEKVTIRYHGHTPAADAVRGLSFAYRDPRGRRRDVIPLQAEARA